MSVLPKQTRPTFLNLDSVRVYAALLHALEPMVTMMTRQGFVRDDVQHIEGRRVEASVWMRDPLSGLQVRLAEGMSAQFQGLEGVPSELSDLVTWTLWRSKTVELLALADAAPPLMSFTENYELAAGETSTSWGDLLPTLLARARQQNDERRQAGISPEVQAAFGYVENHLSH